MELFSTALIVNFKTVGSLNRNDCVLAKKFAIEMDKKGATPAA
jgi:hypothetical protein